MLQVIIHILGPPKSGSIRLYIAIVLSCPLIGCWDTERANQRTAQNNSYIDLDFEVPVYVLLKLCYLYLSKEVGDFSEFWGLLTISELLIKTKFFYVSLSNMVFKLFWNAVYRQGQLGGHSMTTWTRRGGRWSKNSLFLSTIRVKTVHVEVGGGQKRAKLCPRSHWMPLWQWLICDWNLVWIDTFKEIQMFSNYFFLNLMIKFRFLQIANPVVRGNSKNTIEHG